MDFESLAQPDSNPFRDLLTDDQLCDHAEALCNSAHCAVDAIDAFIKQHGELIALAGSVAAKLGKNFDLATLRKNNITLHEIIEDIAQNADDLMIEIAAKLKHAQDLERRIDELNEQIRAIERHPAIGSKLRRLRRSGELLWWDEPHAFFPT